MPEMAQEETQRYNSSSGGGCGGFSGGCGGSNRSSKKLKQKKVPQRGLGVAQLEKIRLEEQQKKDAAVQTATLLSPNSIISPRSSSSFPNLRHNHYPSFPPASSTDLPSSNSIFRQPTLIPNIDVIHPNSGPMPKQMNVGGTEMGMQGISGSWHGDWPKSWNGEYNLEGENHKLDDQGSLFSSNMNLLCESNPPIWPLPSIMQKSHQFQQPYPSTMIEPPSNQSYCGNNFTPLWPEEERMVGMKRSYPFTIDNAPGPPFNCKFPPAYVSPIPGIDASTSCSNEGTSNIEQARAVLREGPSSSSESNMKKFNKEYENLNGDFLTLAPPPTSHQQLNSIPKHPSRYPSQELPNFETVPYLGKSEFPIYRPRQGQSVQQTFFSFLPSASNTQNDLSISNSSGEVMESVDLTLKL